MSTITTRLVALLLAMTAALTVGTVHPAEAAPNTQQNRVFRDAVRACERTLGVRLNKDDTRKLHEAITGQGLSYRELVEECVGMFWHRRTRKPKGTGGAQVLMWVGVATVISAISTPAGVSVLLFSRPRSSRGFPCPEDSITPSGRCLA